MAPRVPVDRLVMRGYGPLLARLVVLALLITALPSRPPSSPGDEQRPETSGAFDGPAVAGAEVSAGAPGPSSGQVATGGARAGLGTVTRASNCTGGDRQVRLLKYSPPCIRFSGANGGATWRGVTQDAITATCRLPTGGGQYSFEQVLQIAAAQGVKIVDSFEDQVRTAQTMIAYYNRHFQFYGRRIELKIVNGRGNPLEELLGGGQEAAAADALDVAENHRAFIEMCALTEPYADALARQGVIAVGALHMPSRWYESRAPYAYGYLPDCTRMATVLVDYALKRFRGQNARYAGDPAYRQRQRTLGVFVPDQPWYQECINGGVKALQAAGFTVAKRVDYALDVNKLATYAANAVSQFKDADVTTVVCFCDPITPVFMTSAARDQDYWPEWFVSGVLLTDVDAVAQFYDQDQWAHAAGISFLSEVYGGKAGEAYKVYKAMSPDTEPATLTHHLYYYGTLMVALGVQMAGPELTPMTYRQGLFNYPKSCGEAGCWSWGPQDLTAMDDAREIYYDPKATSPLTCQRGHYVTTLGARRFTTDWPVGMAEFPVPPLKDEGGYGEAVSEENPKGIFECGK